MSDIKKFLKKLFQEKTQVYRIKLLRNNQEKIKENLFWLFHFYTLIFLLKGKWPQALELLELVMEINDILNDMKINAHSKYLQICCYHYLGDYKRAEDILKERIHIYHFLKDWTSLGEALYHLGTLYAKKDPNKALTIFTEASEYFSKDKKWKELAYNLIGIGEIYFIQEDMERAELCFNKAYENSKKASSVSGMLQCLNWSGLINEYLEKYEEASKKYEEAIILSKEECPALLYSLSNQARIHKKMNKYKEALIYYRKVMELRKEVDFKQALGKNLYYRGYILMHTGLLKKAYRCFCEALNIFSQIGHWQAELCLLQSIGVLKWNMGEEILSLSYFLNPGKSDKSIYYKNQELNDIKNFESYNFSPVTLKYTDRGKSEFYNLPYIGNIQFTQNTIFDFSQENRPQQKLIEVLENFIGKGHIHQQVACKSETPLINRKLLQKDFLDFAILSYKLENFKEAGDLLEETLSIIFYTEDDNLTEYVLFKLKEIYIKTGFYQEGIIFFKKIRKKAFERNMYRTVAVCYKCQGDLLVKVKHFSEAMVLFRKSLSVRKKIGERQPFIKMLIKLGQFHQSQKGYPIAERYFKDALEECNRGDFTEEKIQILKDLATLYLLQKKQDRAISLYMNMAEEAEKLLRPEEKFIYSLLAGNNCEFLGKLKKALSIYKKTLIISSKYRNTLWFCRTLSITGNIYEEMGLYKKAQSCYNFMYKEAKKISIENEIINSLIYMSGQKFLMGNINKAENLIMKALNIKKEHTEKLALWKIFIYSGRIKQEKGETEESHQNFQKAFKLSTEELVTEPLEGSSNFYLGISFYIKGNINQSLFYLREAKKYYTEELIRSDLCFYKRRKACTYNYLSLISLTLGNLKDGESYSSISLKLYKEMDIMPGYGESLSIAGEIHQKLGNYKKAEKFFKKALSVYRKINDINGKYQVMASMGKLYVKWKKFLKATGIFQKIIKERKFLQQKKLYSSVIHNLGYALYCRGKYEEGLEKINIALPLFREMNYRLATVIALKNSGHIHLEQGNINQSIEDFSIALKISEDCGFLNQKTILLYEIARIFIGQEKYKEAQNKLNEAIETAQKLCRNDLLLKINFEVANLLKKQKKYDKALIYYENLLKKLEGYPWLPLIDFEENYTLENFKELAIFNSNLEYFLQSGQNEEALNLAERTKAFIRLKNLQIRSKGKPLKSKSNEELFKKEFDLRRKLKELNYRIINQDEIEKELIQELSNNFSKKIKDYRMVISEILKKFPEYEDIYKSPYLKIKELKKTLPTGSSFIEYYLTEKNMLLFWLYASPGNFYNLRLARLPIQEVTIKKNLPEELSKKEIKNLLGYIETKFPLMDMAKDIYYAVGDKLVLYDREV